MKPWFLIAACFLANSAFSKNLFPSSPRLDDRVRFWERVFSEHSSEESIIHDPQEDNLVIGVCKLPDECKVFAELIASFARLGPEARHESKQHYGIWQLYKKKTSSYQRLLNGKVRLRSQLGLSDIFERATLNAELYLPKMESIFRSHGLPPDLTRIVFVESMFNLNARSKVGASGIWQLMPSAAKPHIHVSRKRDDRNSPLRATYAAAQILKANKKRLGNWPLAITAYNHGVNGVHRGVKQTGSDKLSDLIESYRSPSFGFASRNFYAEFLAAHKVYGRLQAQKKAQISSVP